MLNLPPMPNLTSQHIQGNVVSAALDVSVVVVALLFLLSLISFKLGVFRKSRQMKKIALSQGNLGITLLFRKDDSLRRYLEKTLFRHLAVLQPKYSFAYG